MIAQQVKHRHDFTIPVKRKVLVHDHESGNVVGHDVLLQRKCSNGKCKAVETYDMKRIKR